MFHNKLKSLKVAKSIDDGVCGIIDVQCGNVDAGCCGVGGSGGGFVVSGVVRGVVDGGEVGGKVK